MLIRRQTTNLLEIFWELSLYSQVILKSMKVADDISRGTLECEWVNIGHHEEEKVIPGIEKWALKVAIHCYILP